MDSNEDYPQFTGPVVQWPKYGAAYRDQQFVIAPVPTDDGRWLLGIDDWSDANRLYPTVVAAIDAALGIIKDTVDQRAAAANEADPQIVEPDDAGQSMVTGDASQPAVDD